jgi:hypothetical protein
MIGVAAVGVVVAVVGTIVAWGLIGKVNGSTRDTLDVTIDTIDSVESSIDLADDVLEAATQTIVTAGSTLDAVVTSFDESTGVIASVDDLTGVVGPSLADATDTLRTLEGVGNGIDTVLADLSNIPFGPDYNADEGLGTTIGNLADNLEQLPAAFAETSSDLAGFSGSLEELSGEVSQLSSDIDEVTRRLEDRDELVAQYRTNIAEARRVAIETRDGIDGDIGWMRVILVIGGLNFAIAQIVPFWVGRELLVRSAADDGTGVDTPTSVRDEIDGDDDRRLPPPTADGQITPAPSDGHPMS